MERLYAFTDESGNWGFNFNQDNISTHFIVTAIIVSETKLDEVESQVEQIRKRFFQTGEMKSSSVSKNHARRCRILNDLLECDFNIFSVVVDKRQIKENSGLMYKTTFYKFLNNLVHKELRHAFEKLTICADEIGRNEYMQSFCKYVQANEDIPNLFNEREFGFENSKNKILIQAADFIGGTLSFVYEEDKKKDAPDYYKMLKKKIIRIEHYPKVIMNYRVENQAITDEYDKTIANICLRLVQAFISKNEDSDVEDVRRQVLVVKYLSFRFLNNDTRKYIPTKELITNLAYKTGERVSTQYFRTRLIAKIRDAGVIISSSSKGYKIPAKETELYDFINHGTTIIMPMLSRLKKCRDNIYMGTNKNLDLFDQTEYSTLKQFFEI